MKYRKYQTHTMFENKHKTTLRRHTDEQKTKQIIKKGQTYLDNVTFISINISKTQKSFKREQKKKRIS